MKTSARPRPGTPVSRREEGGVRQEWGSISSPGRRMGGKMTVRRVCSLHCVRRRRGERSDLALWLGDLKLADVCHEQRTCVEL